MYDEDREEERQAGMPAHERERWQPDGMSAPPEAPEKPFTYNGQRVPVETMRGLQAYLLNGTPPGGWLTAVLSNDLSMAVLKADAENLAALPAIVAYVYQEVPSAAWGSPQKVRSWIARHEAERQCVPHQRDNTEPEKADHGTDLWEQFRKRGGAAGKPEKP